jgi:hypothetical protein
MLPRERAGSGQNTLLGCSGVEPAGPAYSEIRLGAIPGVYPGCAKGLRVSRGLDLVRQRDTGACAGGTNEMPQGQQNPETFVLARPGQHSDRNPSHGCGFRGSWWRGSRSGSAAASRPSGRPFIPLRVPRASGHGMLRWSAGPESVSRSSKPLGRSGRGWAGGSRLLWHRAGHVRPGHMIGSCGAGAFGLNWCHANNRCSVLA